MKRSKFSEEQIIGILREQESDQKTADVCRRHGFSEATFYKYKAKSSGMDISDAPKWSLVLCAAKVRSEQLFCCGMRL